MGTSSLSHVAHSRFGLLDQIRWQQRHLVGDHRMHLELGQDVIHRVALDLEVAALLQALQRFGHGKVPLSDRTPLCTASDGARARARLFWIDGQENKAGNRSQQERLPADLTLPPSTAPDRTPDDHGWRSRGRTRWWNGT